MSVEYLRLFIETAEQCPDDVQRKISALVEQMDTADGEISEPRTLHPVFETVKRLALCISPRGLHRRARIGRHVRAQWFCACVRCCAGGVLRDLAAERAMHGEMEEEKMGYSALPFSFASTILSTVRDIV